MSINYNREGDIIEIIVRDSTGRKIEEVKCNGNDRKRYGQILIMLKEKFGFKPEIDFDESINQKKGIDWIDTDMNW